MTRNRKYDDTAYIYKLPHPRNAPEWTYVEQDTTYETDVEDTRNTPDQQSDRDTPSNEEIIKINVEQSGYSSCEETSRKRKSIESGDEYTSSTDEDNEGER